MEGEEGDLGPVLAQVGEAGPPGRWGYEIAPGLIVPMHEYNYQPIGVLRSDIEDIQAYTLQLWADNQLTQELAEVLETSVAILEQAVAIQEAKVEAARMAQYMFELLEGRPGQLPRGVLELLDEPPINVFGAGPTFVGRDGVTMSSYSGLPAFTVEGIPGVQGVTLDAGGNAGSAGAGVGAGTGTTGGDPGQSP